MEDDGTKPRSLSKKRVLFVCTGNVCRSPMAEGLFRDLARDRPDIEVASAGIGAMGGQPPSAHAVEVMRELGVEISHLRSKPIMPEMVRQADFIFVMTYGHLDSMLLLFPQASEKTFLVREFEPDLPVLEREVADPIGSSKETYRRCRDQIRAALPRLLDIVTRTETAAGAGTAEARQMRVAIGSDKAGREVKARLAEWLAAEGIAVEDCGASSKKGTGLPGEFILRVARAVSYGDADWGVLLDETGLMSTIVANKSHGVRAALVGTPELARLSRIENDANVICLAARDLSFARAKEILRRWMDASPAAPSPVPPTSPEAMDALTKTEASPANNPNPPSLAEADPAIFAAIESEHRRQSEHVELIASENFTSRAVMEAQGSCLTNKYAEGYPGKRWYGGCEHVDEVERLAIERAKELFKADHANVQPHSGSQANAAVYFSVLQPGDRIMTMDLSHGGHLTHGHKMNFSGRFYDVVHYGVDKETEQLDYDALDKLARESRPKMITAGASAYSRVIDFERMAAIAKSVGAYLFVDMAHIAGLVATGEHPSPVPHADFVTTTTHKTLRGPRGGLILCREEHAKAIDSQVFPGVQGGPLMHVIAGKAVCFGEALRPGFKDYQAQVRRNAKALAEGMRKNGYRIVSGGTDNHVMLVDLRPRGLNGKLVQELLDEVAITVNKNAIPFDTESPFKGGGVRLGSPAVTTRGMKEDEMFDVANLIHQAIENRDKPEKLKEVRRQVTELTRKFPLPY